MNVLLIFALCTTLAIASPLWFDEDEPTMNFRGGALMTPNQLDSFTGQQRLLKRAVFNKRRGRELFGKRSLPLMDYPEDGLILENRFRRRANELFG